MSSIKKTVYEILKCPRITEKSAVVSAESNCVVFQVHRNAKKAEIRNAVEQIFKVKVENVRTVNVLGKVKRVATRRGKLSDWKKAYVKLAEGSSIDVIEGL